VRTVVLRVAALALLLLLALVATLMVRTLQRLPDVTLYLIRSDDTSFTLEPVHRRLRPQELATGTTSAGSEASIRAAIEALAAGPTAREAERGLASEVPPDTRVLDVRLEDGEVTVDLSADFGAGGGTASMIGRLRQVQHTAARPAGVAAVRLLVDGEPLVALGGEGIMVEQPWVAPAEGLPRW
jgi:spore germination protein GerM